MSAVLRLKINSAKPILRGWDHYWSVMMDYAMQEQPFTVKDVYARSNTQMGNVQDFARRLVAGGFIERQGDGSYRVIRKQDATPSVRRDGTVMEGATCNQAMWNLMRGPVGRRGFTVDDLVHYASTDTLQIARTSAKSYVQRLSEAGYLVALQPGKPGTLAVWSLLPKMNTGPKAPKILRTRFVFDPNTEQTVGDAIAEEERS